MSDSSLYIRINRTNYEYDVNSIVKAFYPGRNVRVLTPESKAFGGKSQRGSKTDSLSEEGEECAEITIFNNGAKMTLEGREYEWQHIPPAEAGPGMGDTGGVDSVDGSDRADGMDGAGSIAAANGDKGFKDGFKAFLYKSLQRHTGRTLPWGNLTGIRPTKIAYGMLDEGKSHAEIADFLRTKHFVSDEKIELSIDIAEREREILKEIHYEDGYSLYIGIPFCPTTCLYCSFTSYPIAAYRKMTERYLDCLMREMEYVSKCFRHKVLDSVYIGGGTPTTLEPGQLDRLISGLKGLLDFSTVKEFTVEAGRADSITMDKLKVLYRHGVSRISVNPQTMKQETLDIIGRRASVEQVMEAYALARRAGFTNINMDLILGLPGESAADVQNTIDRVVELAPDSLTVHSLAIKRASRLSRWIVEHGISMLNNTDETMEIAAQGAKRLGMKPYYLYRQKNMSGNFENVGYARSKKYGLYNILIMEEKQTIVALGAGSISKRVYPDGRIERCENVKEVAQYIERIEEMIERKHVLFRDCQL